MAKKNLNIKVDTINSLNKPEGTIKQLDSVLFNVAITEAGEKKDLTSQQVKLFARKSDGKIVEQTTGISITDATNGQLTIDLLNAAVQVPGYVYFELEISDNSGTISTANFIYKVISKVGSDEAIESTNEVATLKKIEEYVAQAKVELQKFKELQTEMLKTNETINKQEDLRVEAERLRSEAENGRVAAETKREEGFNKFEGKINANTEELKNARSATTGEKFDTLDERIDHEVDRLNKKIDVTMLQKEDKESHTIENSVEGMSTDMVVKGCTLQNIMSEISIQATGATMTDTSIIIDNNDSARAGGIIFSTPLIKPNVTYTIIYNIIRNTNYQGMFKLDGHVDYPINSKDIPTTVGINKVTFTTRASFVSSNIKIATTSEIASGSLLELSKEILILEGDYTNKETLSYFKGIKSFGEQENKISILSNGKNLGLKYKTSNNSNIEFNLISDIKEIRLNCNISFDGEGIGILDRNTVYYTPALGGQYSKGTATKTGNIIKSTVLTFTRDEIKNLLEGTATIKIYANNLINSYKPKWTQLEYGTETTSYEPYKCDKKDILLQKLGFDEGLRGLSPTVYDELNDIRSMAIKKVGKYTFTGNETSIVKWVTVTDENFIGFRITNYDIPNLTSNRSLVVCNNFSSANGVIDRRNMYIAGNGVNICIEKSALTTPDIEGFKAWLKANPTTIYYELAEPIETPLYVNINLKTFGEKTYVSFENALSGTSSFKVPVDTTATISRLNRENRALEEENLSLRQDLESTTLALTDSDLELVKQNVDMDFRLMEVEFALDIPQAILSSDIKLKNKKGEVKTMARTPYEMMKIVILSGDYDREDYMHKVGKYYERGRMTKEEHDELMSLMTADEVLSK